MSSIPALPLTSAHAIPQLGLGVWQSPQGAPTQNAVRTAFELGYRHVDTARVYRNESDVGAAIRASGIPREQIFVTTKLWNEDHGYDAALRALTSSLQRLGLDYVDLYLIHWPVAHHHKESWRALEKAHTDGLARSIGVSNYLVRHLDDLLATARIAPHVNQIELTPFLQRRDTVAHCARHEIIVEAYSPLTRGQRLDDPTVRSIAAAMNRSPAQVLLRWNIQRGHVVLPKSVHRERIAENAAIFDFALTADQMTALDGLEENLATGWDPETMA
jgi:diketogulonate reductase-like aldo/keto reductase